MNFQKFFWKHAFTKGEVWRLNPSSVKIYKVTFENQIFLADLFIYLFFKNLKNSCLKTKVFKDWTSKIPLFSGPHPLWFEKSLKSLIFRICAILLTSGNTQRNPHLLVNEESSSIEIPHDVYLLPNVE